MFKETLAPKTEQALEVLKEAEPVKEFYLAGGTGLALQLGHRVSEDLDFFISQEFKPLQLLNEITKSPARLEVENVSQSWGTLKLFYLGVMVSFFTYPYPLLKQPVSFEGVKIASLEDIGCMKITAISDRGIKKDFIDLYFICQQIDFNSLINLFLKKYRDTNFELYHYLKSLAYFEEAEESPEPYMLKKADWETVKQFFAAKVKDYEIL